MTDVVRLTGLRATGFHGVFAHEKREGQEFVVDVVLEGDLSVAGRSDRLEDTVNYAVVADLAHDHHRPLLDLIEALADGDCLSPDRVASVEVTVAKPAAPIPHSFADVSVTIQRRHPAPVVIALGGNLGDRAATLRAAVADLRALPGCA